MPFDRRTLRAFLAAVDHGSLGRAASALRTSQPTVSRSLADLELRLDQKLFERHSKGMALTAAGEALLPHARLLLFEMERAEDALKDLRLMKSGHLRLGAVATIVRGVLPVAMRALLEEAPDITVTLREQTDNDLLASLLGRDVDLVISAALPSDPDLLQVAECRYDDVFVPFCAPDHALAAQPVVTLADVCRQRWVMPWRGATPRRLFDQTLAAAGISAGPEVVIETGSLDAMVAMVAATNLLGWLPGPLIAGAAAAGMIRALAVPELAVRRRFFVYRRASGLLPSIAQRFLDHLPLIGLDEKGPQHDSI